ncbi:hypothetical protein [Archangium sp.]|uniref:hypothetical protein n=1 Tax=Archangium sp. TaxID=1872627 RepID=UPI002D52FA07|nr:hypothetical protein [Archangium sp.]HYO57815.1 hypothetical protein [Archangium sp.]
MKEILKLRVVPEIAALLPPGLGEESSIGTLQLMLDVNDPLVEKLRGYEVEHRTRGATIFTACEIIRRYTPRELAASEHLLVTFWPFFMPTGEECGTVYDESTACSYCGAGARQVSPLHLDSRRIPKTRDIAPTLGGELVVSERLAEAMKKHRITGYELRPLLARSGRLIGGRFQLVIPSSALEAVPPTLFGTNYLAPEPDASRCPHGHVAGHSLLSVLHISRSSLDGNDWACTRQRVGLRLGLFRPLPMMVISQRLYRLLGDMEVRGFQAQVVQLV